MISEEMGRELIHFLVLPLLCPSFLYVGYLDLAVKHLTQGGSKSCKGLLAELTDGLMEVVAPAV